MATAVDEIREGFICPICLKDMGSITQLQEHFEMAHSVEDKVGLQSIKDLFGKAKQKIKKLDVISSGSGVSPDEISSFSSQLTHLQDFREIQVIGCTRSHMESFQQVRNLKTDCSVVETNKLLIRLDKLISNTSIDPTKRKAFEKSIVVWAPDQGSSLCKSCGKGFSLAHRRHHCRLCGQVICTNCSDFITFAYARKLTNPTMLTEFPSVPTHFPRSESLNSLNSLVNSIGEPHIRVCKNCRKLLDFRDQQVDQRYAKPTVVHLYERLKSVMDEADTLCPLYQKIVESLYSGETNYSLRDGQELRVKLIRMAENIDVLSKKILNLGISDENPSLKSQQLQKGIHMCTRNFLQNKLVGLPSLPNEEELIKLQNSRREKLDMQFAAEKTPTSEFNKQINNTNSRTPNRRKLPTAHNHIEAISPDTGWGPEISQTSRQTFERDPLVQQMNIIRNYIRQARAASKFDEVQMLENNLKELQVEFFRQQENEMGKMS